MYTTYVWNNTVCVYVRAQSAAERACDECDAACLSQGKLIFPL